MVLYGLLWPYYCVLWPFMAKYRSDWTCIVFSRGHRSKFIWSCLIIFQLKYFYTRLPFAIEGSNFQNKIDMQIRSAIVKLYIKLIGRIVILTHNYFDNLWKRKANSYFRNKKAGFSFLIFFGLVLS